MLQGFSRYLCHTKRYISSLFNNLICKIRHAKYLFYLHKKEYADFQNPLFQSDVISVDDGC